MKKTLLILFALLMSVSFSFAAEKPVVIMDFSELDRADNGTQLSQQGWLVSGIMDKIATAKYLVIETEGAGDNANGFGGLHFIFQGNDGTDLNGDGVVDNKDELVGWTDKSINGDWVSFSREAGKSVSIVIDLKNVIGDKYDDFLQCTNWARFILGYYGGASAFEGLGFKNVYLTEDFDKPEDAVDLTGGADWGFIFEGSVAPEPEESVIIMDFSDVTRKDNQTTQQGWDEVHKIMDNIAAAKYFVIETEGVGNSADGFWGIQFIFQGGGDGVSVGWTQRELVGNGLSFPRAEGKTVSIAIDLKNVIGDKYDDFLACTNWGQIYLGYYPEGMTAFEGLGFKNAYLTKDFDKPEGAVDLTGGTDWGFIFDGSVASPTGIIQIKPALSQVYNAEGGIGVRAANERVSVYGIDGRLIKQTVAGYGAVIPLSQGIYIVKVGVAAPVKVLVK